MDITLDFLRLLSRYVCYCNALVRFYRVSRKFRHADLYTNALIYRPSSIMYFRRDDLKKISLTYTTSSRARQVISRQTARLKTDNRPNVNYLLRLMSTEPRRDARDLKSLRSKSIFPSPLIIDKTIINGHRDWEILYIIYEIIIYYILLQREKRNT